MNHLSRRQVLAGAVATTAAMTLGAPSVRAQKRRGTLQFVAQADLRVLAFRNNVRGMLKFTAPLFWNVQIA